MEKMKVYCMVLGCVGTNVYIIANTETAECLIIDPADAADFIIKQVRDKELKAVAVLLTHGHFDHILAAEEVADKLEVPILALEKEAALLADPRANASVQLGKQISCRIDKPLKDNEELCLAGFKIKVMHTPGHTSGSCCYYFPVEAVLVSGDTLFRCSYGRTDLETGSDADIIRSVSKLLELPAETVVLPGHMGRTDIGFESRNNPLVSGLPW